MIAAMQNSLTWVVGRLVAGRRANDRYADQSHPVAVAEEEYYPELYDGYDEEPPTFAEVAAHLMGCKKYHKWVDFGGGSGHWAVSWYEWRDDPYERSVEPVAVGRFGGRLADLPMPQVRHGFWDHPDAVFEGEPASLLLNAGTLVGTFEPLRLDDWPEQVPELE